MDNNEIGPTEAEAIALGQAPQWVARQMDEMKTQMDKMKTQIDEMESQMGTTITRERTARATPPVDEEQRVSACGSWLRAGPLRA